MPEAEEQTSSRPGVPATTGGTALVSLFFDPALARNESTQVKGKMLEYLVVALVVIGIAVYEWLRRLIGLPQQLMWMTLFAAGVAGYCAVRVVLLRRRLRLLRMGDRTWRMMQVDFDSLGERGFYLFDGLKDAGGMNLGPVLAGPTGVFSLSIRTNPRTGAFFEKIEHVDERTLLIAGRPALGDPLGQARATTRRVRDYLGPAAPADLVITPILVYPGWNIGKPPTESTRDVIVASEKTLAPEVLRRPRILEPKALIPICEVLSGKTERPIESE